VVEGRARALEERERVWGELVGERESGLVERERVVEGREKVVEERERACGGREDARESVLEEVRALYRIPKLNALSLISYT
jgi:hypothetical protein